MNNYMKGLGLYLIIFMCIILAILFNNNLAVNKVAEVQYSYANLISKLQSSSKNVERLEVKPAADGTGRVKAFFADNTNAVIDIRIFDEFRSVVNKVKHTKKEIEIKEYDFADKVALAPDDNTVEDFTYKQLVGILESKEIARLEIKTDSEVSSAGQVKVIFQDNTIAYVNINSMNSFMDVVNANVAGSGIAVEQMPAPRTSLWVSLIPTLILVAGSVILFMFVMQQMQGGSGGSRVMSFGKSKARVIMDDKNKTTFEQVAGLEEEKLELSEIVEFLKQPKKFVEIGARIPKGVLLVGPPGTGKTLLAKAISGEAGVPFFSISGSDFVEMFVGVGASRVRDLFEQAKKNSPCLVFIDEIDAVGRRRGAGLGGGHDEREQTLNQLLVEMDGFGVNEGVIVIAATNRADILDPALMRPGRFDRRVRVGAPDVKGREEILNVHAKGKQIGDDVDFQVIAKTTPGFTGADLENLLNEAALLAAREDKKIIEMEDLKRAFVKVGVGTEKKSKVISDKERRMTAYHEAGHAIMFEALSELDPVHIISIIPTGWAGGYTMPLPDEDKNYRSKMQMEQELIGLLGGRAAEEVILKDVTTGASNDIERATAIARSMITKYGMSKELGPIQFGDEDQEVFIGRDMGHIKNYSERVASIIDKEIKRIIEYAYSEALRLVNENIDVLHKTAEALTDKEKLTGDEFRKIFNREEEIVCD